MANLYSYNLRQKVIQAIELDSMKKMLPHKSSGLVATRLTCGSSGRTETGDYQAKRRQPLGNGHKITDWEKFQEFAAQHGDKTQAEMAEEWARTD